MRTALINACAFNENDFCSSYGPSSGYDLESNSMWVNGESPILSVNFTLMSDYARDIFLNRPQEHFSGISTKTIIHLSQMIAAEKFQTFDYGTL